MDNGHNGTESRAAFDEKAGGTIYPNNQGMFSGILLLPVLGLENVTGQLFRPVIILFYYYMMVTFDFIPATTGHI